MTRFKENYGLRASHLQITVALCQNETQLLLLDLVMAQVCTSCTRKRSLEMRRCRGNVALTCDGCWELQVSDYGAVLKGCPVSLCKSGSYPESPKGGAPGSVKGSFTEPVINYRLLGDADATSQGLRCEVVGKRRGKNAFGNRQL